MSSAIVIPSVRFLDPERKEHMIYESTFADILGIIFFYSLLLYVEAESKMDVGISVSGNIFITIIVAFLLSYFILFLLQKLKTDVKLFFIIAILVLFYSIGKALNLSSLIIILVFGVILANHNIFVKGFFKKYIKNEEIKKVFPNFQTITIESSFVVRTFFLWFLVCQ